MDQLGPGRVLGPLLSSPRPSPKGVRGRRSKEEDLDAGAELGPKRIKMRDLESVLQSEGSKIHDSEYRKATDEMVHESVTDGAGSSNIADNKEAIHSYKPQPSIAGPSSLTTVSSAACLNLGHVGSSHSPMDGNGSSVQTNDRVMPVLSDGVDRVDNTIPSDGVGNTCTKSSIGPGLDLNATDISSVMEHNPFYPYKNLGHVRPTDPSECGSTTGPLEESESLRKWKEMKQNGFLSSSHGGIPPVPKQRGRPCRKRKEDEQKKKVEIAKREQVNRFTKIASPSGLLSGLNPGIINHVRNSKQVHSIIEAIVRSEKTDGQNHNEEGRGKEEVKDRKTNQFNLPSNRLFSFSVPECNGKASELDLVEERFCNVPVLSQLTSGSEDDNLTLKLSSTGTMASENAGSMSNGDVSVSQDSVTFLSLRAASVASQWLELLYKDTRGRLGALRRSRKRVRYVIQKELPYLLSADSNQENNTYFQQSTGTVSSNYAASIDHVKRWKTLFNQMDLALSEEGKHLETLLEQVKEMQMKCDGGLKSVNDEALPLIGSSSYTRLKKGETSEGEYAVRAAAASLYSTCNMIMTTEDVSCF